MTHKNNVGYLFLFFFSPKFQHFDRRCQVYQISSHTNYLSTFFQFVWYSRIFYASQQFFNLSPIFIYFSIFKFLFYVRSISSACSITFLNRHLPLNRWLWMGLYVYHPLNILFAFTDCAIYGLKSIIINDESRLVGFQNLNKLCFFLFVVGMISDSTSVATLIVSGGF